MKRKPLTNEMYEKIIEDYGFMMKGIVSKFKSIDADDKQSCIHMAVIKAHEYFNPKRGQFSTILYLLLSQECSKIIKRQKFVEKKIAEIDFSNYGRSKALTAKANGKTHGSFNTIMNKFSPRTEAKIALRDLPLEVLSEREQQVLELRLENYSNDEIAKKLNWNVCRQRVNQLFQVACEKLRVASEYRHYYKSEDYPIYKLSAKEQL